MRTTSILTVVAVVLALLIVAKSRTVGLNEATGNPVQSTTMSIYALDAGANMKNLPVQQVTKINLVINLKTARRSAWTCRSDYPPAPTR